MILKNKGEGCYFGDTYYAVGDEVIATGESSYKGADEIGQECVGKTIRVLVDSPGIARGPWDAPDVDGTIHVDPALPVGEFADVTIVDSIAYELFADGAEDFPEEE